MSCENSFWKWADRIAPVDPQSQISLGEGGTPLVRSRRIGPAMGFDNLYFKLETANPSGSFKDRFAVVAVSDLLARGVKHCLATSSGNTGAALATYCAAAGIQCTIAILETTPMGKLSQMLAHGAKLIRVKGFGLDPVITEETFKMLVDIGQAQGSPPQISAFHYSPVGMSGTQTISYELAEQFAALGSQPDHIFIPAGGGGFVLGAAIGFEQLAESGQQMPCIEVVQPEGNDTIASPLRNGLDRAQAVDCTSQISGLQVASVIDGDEVVTKCRASGGTGHTITDEQVWEVQKKLAREEGIFCEPAGAVATAGALQAMAAGEIDPNKNITCLITGSGFKDPVAIDRMNHNLEVPTLDTEEMAALLQQTN
ncbi:MAG: pyridoxal-phosphate dependent enzyme [Planctomycetaceae bacterium]|nr:pyridoxal-phosphate dependent enzyme [Planctomycetaceae bacterium]